MGLLTVLWLMLKQIISNWRLELILTLGLVVAVGVFSSIPLYTDGALQFALMEAWERSGTQSRPPGMVQYVNEQWKDYHPIFSATQERDQEEAFGEFQALDDYLTRTVPQQYPHDLLHFNRLGQLTKYSIRPVEPDGWVGRRYADIRYVTGLEERVDIIDGRWPEQETVTDNHVEVVIDMAARDEMGLFAGRTYQYPLDTPEGESRRYLDVEVVGIFRIKPEMYYQPVWLLNPPYTDTFFVSEDIFEQLVLRDDTTPNVYEWGWVFDHESVRVYELPGLVAGLRHIQSRASQITGNLREKRSPANLFTSFMNRSAVVQILLSILSLPVMGIVLYYIVLVAGLTVRRRRNEIAMLKSRGAGIAQILLIFTIEWGLLCVVALVLGPYLGVLIARIMGSSAGFLTFVGRAPLPVVLHPEAYRYGMLAAGVSLAGCLLQVLPAARHSIVTYKQDIARGSGIPIWQRYYFDIIMLIFSVYGYRTLQNQMESLTRESAGESELLLDPLLFLVPVLFLATAGLLILRIVPWLIRLLTAVTNRLPAVYWSMSLKQLGRDPGRYSPLMLFIILTVSVGIYGASVARTLDQNHEDSIMYRLGSDIVLRSNWATEGGFGVVDDENGDAAPVTIAEPPFYIHKELPGVVDAARVLQQRIRVPTGRGSMASGTVMAIDPVDFASVTWFRSDLTAHHLHVYMNALLSHPAAALISRDAFESGMLELGDWLPLRIGDQEIEFFAAGVIDQWPSIYPGDQPLFVVNLDYLHAQHSIEPYSVWLRINDEARLAEMIGPLREEGIYVTQILDSRTLVVEGRRDPQRMGLFGMLTIGFVVAVLITIFGFFLYTFLSIKDRMLQFGVLRAIGLSVPQLIAMLGLEQLLSVGIALVAGTAFGAIASYTFIPFMQITQDIAGVVPDFLVVVKVTDILQIFAILGTALLIGLIGLGFVISRMQLHQAIKLGEEV